MVVGDKIEVLAFQFFFCKLFQDEVLNIYTVLLLINNKWVDLQVHKELLLVVSQQFFVTRSNHITVIM